MRFEIIRALVKIGDVSAAGALMSYLNYNDSKVRNQAIYAIGRLRYREAVPEFQRLYEKEGALPAKLIDKPYREALLDAMAFIADPATQPFLLKEKQNPEDPLRLHAVEGLARLGDRHWHPRSQGTGWVRRAPESKPRKPMRCTHGQEGVSRRTGKTSRQPQHQYRGAHVFIGATAGRHGRTLCAGEKPGRERTEALAEILGLRGDERAIPALQELAKDQRVR